MNHRLAAGALVEKDDRILLVRHARLGHYDFWVAPGGGVQGTESLRDAARREVLEESGLIVEPQELVYIEELVNPEVRQCKFWYAARLIGGSLSTAAPGAQNEYIVDAAWLSCSELGGKTVFPPVIADRYWKDKNDGFPSLVHLELRRMEFW